MEIDAERQLRTAEQVAERLGQMKGALMKVGQMASYLDDGLPEPVRHALAELQANAPPMSSRAGRRGDRPKSSVGRPRRSSSSGTPIRSPPRRSARFIGR